MRLLSELEKNICNRILQNSGSNNFIANIIDRDLKNVCIIVDRISNTASLEFTIRNPIPTAEEQEYIIERVEELSRFILHLVNLLQMLEKEGYIMMLERGSNSQKLNRFGRCITNSPSIIYTINDQNIVNLLCEYTNKEIYTTEEFSRFCEKGHIAREEQRFKQQFKITRGALVVATLALLLNFVIFTTKKIPDSVKINEAQVKSLKESIDKIQIKKIESEQNKINRAIGNIDTVNRKC